MKPFARTVRTSTDMTANCIHVHACPNALNVSLAENDLLTPCKYTHIFVDSDQTAVKEQFNMLNIIC